jgi:hypothetical protein
VLLLVQINVKEEVANLKVIIEGMVQQKSEHLVAVLVNDKQPHHFITLSLNQSPVTSPVLIAKCRFVTLRAAVLGTAVTCSFTRTAFLIM